MIDVSNKVNLNQNSEVFTKEFFMKLFINTGEEWKLVGNGRVYQFKFKTEIIIQFLRKELRERKNEEVDRFINDIFVIDQLIEFRSTKINYIIERLYQLNLFGFREPLYINASAIFNMLKNNDDFSSSIVERNVRFTKRNKIDGYTYLIYKNFIEGAKELEELNDEDNSIRDQLLQTRCRREYFTAIMSLILTNKKTHSLRLNLKTNDEYITTYSNVEFKSKTAIIRGIASITAIKSGNVPTLSDADKYELLEYFFYIVDDSDRYLINNQKDYQGDLRSELRKVVSETLFH